KQQRRLVGLTQPECAHKAWVSVAFLRNLEQGKKTLQMDKVNQVLKLFGGQLGVVPVRIES
ncbi:MAG: transcriptional regulator, partial [Bacteroidetes bacterium]|nr:transcriptional regulator [Bacteroidota bacterium]